MDDNRTKTPTEYITDFPSVIRNLLMAILQTRFKKIEISDSAWKVIDFIVLISLLHYFRDSLLEQNFLLLIGLALALLILEIATRNWQKISRMFRGEKTFEEFEEIGFDEEKTLNLFDNFTISKGDLFKVFNKFKQDKRISLLLIDRMIETQKLDSKLAKKILEYGIASTTLIKMMEENEDIFDKKDLGKILSKYSGDKEIVKTCLTNQNAAADVFVDNKIGGITNKDLPLLRSLHFSKYEKTIRILTQTLSFVIFFFGFIFFYAYNASKDSNYGLPQNVLIFLLMFGMAGIFFFTISYQILLWGIENVYIPLRLRIKKIV